MTTVDWAATGTMLQGIGTVIGAAAVIVAAFIGSRTFDSWKRQKLAERHIDQAERILTATYNVRRALSYVRNIATWSHESDAAEARLKESDELNSIYEASEKKRLISAQVYLNRLHAIRDDQRALEECQPMARALFSEDLEKAIEKLNRQFWTVEVYAGASRRDAGGDPDFRRKIESILWEGYPSAEENEMDQTIAAQVKIIEHICVPALRVEGRKR